MLGYIGNEIALSARQKDGATLREHLKSLERQSGNTPEQLREIPCEESAKYLWWYFLSMNARRGTNGFSANPITNAEVLAWSARKGIKLEPFENDILDSIETLFMTLTAPKKEDK